MTCARRCALAAFALIATGIPGSVASARAGAASEPRPAQVSDLFIFSGSDEVGITWVDPKGPVFNGVVIQRRRGEVAPSNPTQGVRVASLGRRVSFFADSHLTPGRTYSYAVFSKGVDHRRSAGADFTVQTVAELPQRDAVSNLYAEPGSSTVALGWTNPKNAGFVGVEIRRSSGTSAPTSITDGSLVAKLGPSATGFTDRDLPLATDYSYSVFAAGRSGLFAPPQSEQTTTYSSTLQVSDLQLSASGVPTLSWTNPSDPYEEVEIRGKDGSLPAGRDDPIAAYADPGDTSVQLGAIAPGQTYTLSAFVLESGDKLGAPTSLTVSIPATASVVAIDGSLPADETWSPSDASEYDIAELTIPPGRTLTIEPGAVVRFDESSGSVPASACVFNDGTLRAIGTSSEPVTFESPVGSNPDNVSCDLTPDGGLPSGITGSGITDLEDDSLTNVTLDLSGPAITVVGNQLDDSRVVVKGGTLSIVAGNSATYDLTPAATPLDLGAAYDIDGQINLSRLGGNTAQGDGLLGIQISGGIYSSSGFPGGPLPLLVGESSLAVGTGAAAFFGPGSIVKFAGGAELLNFGDVFALGTSASPVTFTSINDNSVGGSTGSGLPNPTDWYGISGGYVNLSYAAVDYARYAVGRSSRFVVTDSTFTGNDVALQMDGIGTETSSVSGSWFDGNRIALGGASDWIGNQPSDVNCRYEGTVAAAGNSFGPAKLPTALVSLSDYQTIQQDILKGDVDSPPGWTQHIAPGTTDHIDWSVQSCVEGADLSSVLATGYDLTKTD